MDTTATSMTATHSRAQNVLQWLLTNPTRLWQYIYYLLFPSSNKKAAEMPLLMRGFTACGSTILEYSSFADFANLSLTAKTWEKHLLQSKEVWQGVQELNSISEHGQLSWIAKRAANLRKLSAGHAAFGSINDATLNVVARSCPMLQSVDLTENKLISGTGLCSLADSCPHLSTLHLSKVSLTDTTLIHLAKRLTRLTTIEVVNCVSLTPLSMIVLAQSCKFLMRIDFSHCETFSDAALEAFARNCPMLHVVILIKCLLVNDSSVITLAEHCLELREINLSRTRITDASIISISSHSKYLELLDVSHNGAQITDGSIIEIAEGCKQIRILRVSWCQLVTDVSIIEVANKSLMLEQLYVRDCFLVTDASLDVLREERERPVQIFDF